MNGIIKPQAGFQEMALATSADIAILGGTAGCGKTFTLLMESLRNIRVPGYGGVIFRRTTPQIMNEGALWDTAATLYPHVGGIPRETNHAYDFPNKTKIKFA